MSFNFGTNSICFRFVHFDRAFKVASFSVLHNNFVNFTACNSLSERKTSFGKDKHISGCIVVRLETGKVPSAKLFKVYDTIFVKIKIIQGFFKLIFVERMTEISRKLLKFSLIDRTTGVFVKPVEGWFYIFIIFLIVLLNHFFHWLSKRLGCFTCVFEVDKLRFLFDQIFFKICLNITQNGLYFTLVFILHFLTNKIICYWYMTIISDDFIFKLKLFGIKLIQENKASKVISIYILSFKEFIITGRNELYKGMLSQILLI